MLLGSRCYVTGFSGIVTGFRAIVHGFSHIVTGFWVIVHGFSGFVMGSAGKGYYDPVWVISRSFKIVFQLRMVLVVPSLESKYWLVSLVRPNPLGQCR